jgi:spore photoproduct lyase
VINKGLKPAITIDPIIKIPNYKIVYKNFIKELFDNIEYKKIDSIVIGTFRMNSTQFKNIKKSGLISDILYYNYDVRNGVVSYKDDKEIEEYIKSLLPNVKMVEL